MDAFLAFRDRDLPRRGEGDPKGGGEGKVSGTVGS